MQSPKASRDDEREGSRGEEGEDACEGPKATQLRLSVLLLLFIGRNTSQ